MGSASDLSEPHTLQRSAARTRCASPLTGAPSAGFHAFWALLLLQFAQAQLAPVLVLQGHPGQSEQEILRPLLVSFGRGDVQPSQQPAPLIAVCRPTSADGCSDVTEPEHTHIPCLSCLSLHNLFSSFESAQSSDRYVLGAFRIFRQIRVGCIRILGVHSLVLLQAVSGGSSTQSSGIRL